jgi:hypothetical protein
MPIGNPAMSTSFIITTSDEKVKNYIWFLFKQLQTYFWAA